MTNPNTPPYNPNASNPYGQQPYGQQPYGQQYGGQPQVPQPGQVPPTQPMPPAGGTTYTSSSYGGGYGGGPQGPGGYGQPSGGKNKLIPILIGAIVLVIVVATVLFFAKKKDPDPAPQPEPTIGETTETQPATPTNTPTNTPTSTGRADISELQVGDCMQFVATANTSTNNPESMAISHREVPCAPNGEFKLQVDVVTTTDAECPAGDYVSYRETGIFGQIRICVSPVVEEGVCYTYDPIYELIPADCSASGVVFKGGKTMSGTDYSSCPYPQEDSVLIFPEPAPGRVTCLVAPTD